MKIFEKSIHVCIYSHDLHRMSSYLVRVLVFKPTYSSVLKFSCVLELSSVLKFSCALKNLVVYKFSCVLKNLIVH